MKINRDKFFCEEIEYSPNIEESMYEQLQRNVAKCIDIEFAKTPIIDLWTGYIRYKRAEDRIDKAIEWVHKHISKYNCKGITIIDWDELSNPNDLLEILGDKENE